jgi:WXG100 family type VII secretion target
MATAPTQADVAGMLAAQPHFETAVSATSSSYSAMQDQADTLAASWKGDASAAFITALNDWLEQCNIVKQQLQSVLDKLQANTHQYDQVHGNTVDSATAIKQAIAAGLPGM